MVRFGSKKYDNIVGLEGGGFQERGLEKIID
jgi:hypothetical protein